MLGLRKLMISKCSKSCKKELKGSRGNMRTINEGCSRLMGLADLLNLETEIQNTRKEDMG